MYFGALSLDFFCHEDIWVNILRPWRKKTEKLFIPEGTAVKSRKLFFWTKISLIEQVPLDHNNNTIFISEQQFPLGWVFI